MDYNEYFKLKKEINKHNKLYYDKCEPEISDREYDELFLKLIKYEKENPDIDISDSPSQRVGCVISDFEKVKHSKEMLSIKNSYDYEDLEKFINDCKKVGYCTYVSELKIDGLAISVKYENGIMTRALTRGDGEFGEDVTHAVKVIQDIPLTLKEKLNIEVRGEIFMEFSTFTELNKIRKNNGENLLMNPRNAAAGVIKRKDSTTLKEYRLRNFMYNIVDSELSQSETLRQLKYLGFKIEENWKHSKELEKIKEHIELWDKNRMLIDYPVDGMVIKVDGKKQRDLLGTTNHHPKWIIAYKFKAEEVSTELLSITYQVGKSGIITPVAELKPVELAGTIVKRASMHNYEVIKNKDIRYGDHVFVEKSGEIIPYIVSVDINARDENSTINDIISPPKECPCCGGDVYFNETFAVCKNKNCPDQIKGKIEYFVSKGCMNIDDMGPSLINQLVDKGLVKDISDLYELTEEQLSSLDRMGKKSAINVIKSIQKSKQNTFDKVLCGLQIHRVGRTLSKILAKEFKNIDNLMSATTDDLESVEDVGEITSGEIKYFFINSKNVELVNKLKDLGLNFKYREETSEMNSEKVLSGKNLLGTGKLEKFTRDSLNQAIIENGGSVSSSVNKKVDYLIVGEKAGSKLTKAKELGIPTLSEDEFLEMIS